MKDTQRQRVSALTGLVALAGLVALTGWSRPAPATALPLLVFIPLLTFTATFGVLLTFGRIKIGRVSLLPLATLAAYLALGFLWAGWAAWIGALAYTLLQNELAPWLGTSQTRDRWRVIALALANAAIQTISLGLGHIAFDQAGGLIPWRMFNRPETVAFVWLAGVYLGTNYMLAGLFIRLRGVEPWQLYWRSLGGTILTEASQIIFAPLVALIYLRLGTFQLLLFAAGIGVISVIMHSLDRASQDLKRRVEELDSLRTVSESLSRSLDLTLTLTTVHQQIQRLMPAANFYVALYQPDLNEVSFPLVMEAGQPQKWTPRRAGNGFTEFVLRTRAPLLVEDNVPARAQAMQLDVIGRPACSWLGVPLFAGQELLGVITVQSYTDDEHYDRSHEKILAAIAGQAALAIQNARLYAQTDAALTRRVQELDSILRTIGEGVLLFDEDWRVVAVNQTLAEWVGLPAADIRGSWLCPPETGTAAEILTRLGYSLQDLRADCQGIAAVPEGPPCQKTLRLAGPPERQIERTLAAVRNRAGGIEAWLLVLRDVTEEQELTRLRDDMTQMLVHDLRSPLSIVISSLGLIPTLLEDQDIPSLTEVLEHAQEGSQRLMTLINDLLDISKLESGNMPLQRGPADAALLLSDTAAQLQPLANAAHITLTVEVAPNLPLLDVDTPLVRRALHNLVDNALKFAPEGGHVRLWADSHASGRVRLGVSDNGPGIPLEAQPWLYRKFQQGNLRKGRRRGTGLGLPFCKLVAEAHGGQIGLDSQPGAGTTFVLSLPAEPVNPAPASPV